MQTRWLGSVAAAGLLLGLAGGCATGRQGGSGAARLPGPLPGQASWTVPDLRLRLAYVAPGSFQMGATDGEADQQPVHQVRITRGFWMGTVEVTRAEYHAVMADPATASVAESSDSSPLKDSRNPIESVSWDDAVTFCAKLTAREHAAGRLPEGYEYRLPTEAEWEYAARGGARSRGHLFSGSNNPARVAWYDANSDGRPHPVARKAPNELGLYDMSGNVWEWCLDGYDPAYYARSPATDPVNLQAGEGRVFRGGCWGFSATFVRSTCRSWLRPGNTCDGLGFRVVLAAPASGTPPGAATGTPNATP